MSISYSLIPLMLLGILCLWIGVGRWKESLSCKEEIQGVFIGLDVLGFGNRIYTSANFEYTYHGKKLRQHTLERLSREKRKEFQKGKIYTLYVNPKNPKIVRCTRNVFRFENFFLVILGGFFYTGFFFPFAGGII